MLDAALWGLVQGLTEFLPISSSGHLVLVPAFLDKEAPGLATTAVLHLGTLAAVLAYFRQDVLTLLRAPGRPESRTIWKLLILGTIPAVVLGLAFESSVEDLFDSPVRVGLALIGTGVVLLGSGWIADGLRKLEQGRNLDAWTVGLAQAAALVPGISRSGMTITAAQARQFTREEAARFSFLLAIPVIAGGGALELFELAGEGGVDAELAVGVVVAAISGYLAIAGLIKVLTRYGLRPFAFYCFVVGLLAIFTL